jgi:AcrR family transcriptional regulator
VNERAEADAAMARSRLASCAADGCDTPTMGARDQILDAATGLIARGGLRAVNIAAVAAEAGLSRQTVYVQFGTREELLSETVSRLALRSLDEINAAVASIAEAGEYAVEVLVAVRSQFRRHPVLGALIFPDSGNPIFDEELFAKATPIAAEFLRPLLERAPELGARWNDVVEIFLRIGLSLLLFDSEAVGADDDLRAFLHRTLVPALALKGSRSGHRG